MPDTVNDTPSPKKRRTLRALRWRRPAKRRRSPHRRTTLKIRDIPGMILPLSAVFLSAAFRQIDVRISMPPSFAHVTRSAPLCDVLNRGIPRLSISSRTFRDGKPL